MRTNLSVVPKKRWIDYTPIGKVVTAVSVSLCIAVLMGMYNFASSIPKDIKRGSEAYDKMEKMIVPSLDSLKANDIRQEHRQDIYEKTTDEKLENIENDGKDTKEMVRFLYENEIKKNRYK